MEDLHPRPSHDGLAIGRAGPITSMAGPLATSQTKSLPPLGVALLTGIAILVSLWRDAAAGRWPGSAGTITLAGYAALLLVAVAACRYMRIGIGELGLGRGRLGPRLGGGAALALVLTGPALIHGVSTPLALAAVLAAAGVAVTEEVLFRGVLFVSVRSTFGVVPAVVVSSVAFAAAHAATYPIAVLLLGLVVGLLLGTWRAIVNDLVGPILAHTIADAVAGAALAGG